MSITLEDVEAAAWHFSIEPTPPRMDDFLQLVRPFIPAEEKPEEQVPAALDVPETESGPPAETVSFDKTCARCHQVKPASSDRELSEFGLDSSNKDGFRSSCKPCQRIQRAAQRKRQQARDAH
jgi:hypothetical protein